MATLLRRVRRWIRRNGVADELAEELRFHREMAERDLRQTGLDDVEAIQAARRQLGNDTLAREDAEAVWFPAWVDGLCHDVRQAFRSLRRSPGLVVVSALSLGLGIGLNALLYMGVSTVYLHEPTMLEGARIVGVEPGSANQFSYPDYTELVRSGIFADAAGFRTDTLTLGSGAHRIRVSALAVTANFFDVLGAGPQIGRAFSAGAAAERDPREVVVTAGFWRAYLGGEPSAIGQSIAIRGEPFTIVGILPDDYRAVTGWVGPQLYVPLSRLLLPTIDDRGSPSLTVIARLQPDSTAARAEEAATALTTALERMYPERLGALGRRASVFPVSAMQFRGGAANVGLFVALIWVVAGLVLLIACVNVAGLLLARAAQRRRETAVRVAIGAGRRRVIQAMLVESFLLVGIGAAAGLPLAFALNQIPFPSPMVGFQNTMRLDARLLPFAAGMVALTTVLCGLIPALRATRADVISEVRQCGEAVTRRFGLRSMLVTGQVAMSLVLVVAAFLCVRSEILVGRTSLGFDIEHGVVASFGLEDAQYPGQERVRFAGRLIERIQQIPGVTSVTAANLVPLGGASLVRSFHPAGRTDIPGTRPSTFSVGPKYFQTLSVPVVRGREFAESDTIDTPAVAIVNETYARTYFPGRDALGERVQTANEADARVVGVVKDYRIGTIGEAPQSVVYYAYAQRPRGLMIHLRTSAAPDALVAAVQTAVSEVDDTVPVSVQTLRAAASLEMTMRRVGTVMMGGMGLTGLLLALVGLYGVMTYLAVSRTAEVGIRMALGATPHRVGQEMLRASLRIVSRGVILGALASAALMPALSTFLAGVSPFDLVSFAGAAAMLTGVCLAASALPAWRSARLDPVQALRRL